METPLLSPFRNATSETLFAKKEATAAESLALHRSRPSLSDIIFLPNRGSCLKPCTSNPLKMGLPKREATLRSSLEAKCFELGGNKPIHSVLVANNGIAAVKFIRSIRSWAYKTFGSELAVVLVAMATPEDMQNAAEHVHMADQFVEVPGGSNNNNYANVPLIVQVAERANVDAVWPGWGHASEKPELPAALLQLRSNTAFLGPPKGPMAALGDKIGSTILAQTANVPTIPWSGSAVTLDPNCTGSEIPADIYERACIHSADQAVSCCQDIGFPVMLKASWGGGGKGIRRCMNEDDVQLAFKQVQGEVPGSPIFAMKLASTSRHVEVQLLCDEHGNCCSLFSRDCSVQRRHQKIIEEGPVTKASQETLQEMEMRARALARSVGYVGAATVEYLYDLNTEQYYFLELNPRLQVEHPVTEWISQVNIPACQLMIGMGIPLWRIPDIRRLYGKELHDTTSPIDFEQDPQLPPSGHVVAVRITCEDANDNFKPTCGIIDELSFRPSPETWGYFSVKSGSGIHSFSDSQFGHIFAKGTNREGAIRALVVALKEIKIRGEIRTIVDYAIEMIQSPEFLGNSIHTGWLDYRVASQIKAEQPAWHLGVIAGALLRTLDAVACRSADYLGYLEKGQLPPARLTLTRFQHTFVLQGIKYEVGVMRTAPQDFRLHLLDSAVDVVARKLNDGGLLIQVDGESHVVHSEEEALGTRLTIDGLTCLLANETDSSKLLAVSPGKLIRYLVDNGSHVSKDQAFAEIEVMKMMMLLMAPADGNVQFEMLEGSVLSAGDLVARLDQDDPAASQEVTPCTGGFPEMGPPVVHSLEIHYNFKAAFAAAENVLQGYEHSVDAVVTDLLTCLDNPALALMQWHEAFSVAETRLPGDLKALLSDCMAVYEESLFSLSSAGSESEDSNTPHTPGSSTPLPAFPSEHVLAVMHHEIQAQPLHERTARESVLEPLIRVAEAHQGGKQEYARSVIKELFDAFLRVEERFAGKLESTDQEVIDSMRTVQEYSSNLGEVVDIVVSHQGLPAKTAMVLKLMDAVVVPAPDSYRQHLQQFAELGGSCAEVASRAQQVLEQSLFDELRTVVATALSGLETFSGNSIDMTEPRDPPAARTLHDRLSFALANCSPHFEAKRRMLVESPAAVEDALASLLDNQEPRLQQRCLLTYISRVYFPFIVREPEVGCTDGIVWAVWLHTPHRTSSSRSCLHLGLALLLPSLAALPAALNSVEDILCQSAVGDTERGTLHVIVTNTLGRPGLCSPSDSATSVKGSKQQLRSLQFLQCNRNDHKHSAGCGCTDAPREEVIQHVASISPTLQAAGYSSLSVMITRGAQLPMRVGLWRQGKGGFSEDPLMSSVEPMSANVLELERLAGGGRKIHHCSSRDRQCHIYLVIEGSDTRSPLKRVFTRMVLRQLSRPALLVATYKGDAAGMATAAMEEVEKPLALCLQELEGLSLTSGDPSLKPDWAHVFISVLPPLPLGQVKEEARIVLALKAACAGIMSRYGPALRRAQVAQVEVRMRVADNSGAWRMVVSSPSGHEVGEENVEIYRESVTEPVQYISKHTKYEEQGALHGMSVHASYPALDTLQRRRLAAKRHRTTYCYDFPSVFNTALRDIWTARSANGEPGSMPSGRLVEAEELVMAPEGTFMHPAAMTPVTRTIGSNDVGIVAWLLTMKTPECPQGRQVVAVANDITFNLGSFGPAEDAVFRSATEYALEEHLPLVYLAANSGARVGLANEVKQCLQVEWNDPADPSKGFKYLYLPDQDYQAIWKGADHPWIKAKPITVQGEDRWIIKHVVGREDGLGVECLSGSGAIASAYAKAFREGLTITYVSSRTVGIGAYLARLGRRCIQRADQPIILTGYSALNKLLGREVYSSQLQLGGPKVMGVNGVSHQTVTDDLDGATAVLKWLGTMPPVVGVPPSPLPSSDPVERAIGYCPGPNEKLNPRAAIAGREATDSEPWLSGLFDRGTWQESHAGWAQSVVTGRARLGGIAVGIVATETSSTMLSIPADPGAPDTSERNIAQSGQVWYPNSALKTAHAIEEFDREGLPLIILANWRGFSGGQRDLFDGVLQAGSLIVESLRTYQQPIMVYMPPGAELRGGAWVVIDGQINAHQVEMYADSSARGGVLEPEAIVEIKFRTPDLIKAMHRLDPELKRMMAGTGGSQDVAAIKQREAALLPIYRQVAVAFAEMHDTPIRMVAKGVLHGIVPWSRARPFLAIRLRRRLAEEEIVKHITTTDAGINRLEALEQFRSWYAANDEQAPMTPVPSVLQGSQSSYTCSPPESSVPNREPIKLSMLRMSSSTLEARAWSDDRAFLEWVDGAGAYIIANELKAVRIRAACRAVSELTSSAEGREGLLQGLKSALTGDGALRAQLASILQKTMRHHEPINGIPEAATPRRYRRPYAEPMKPSSLLEQADLEQPIQPIISNLL